MTTNMIVSRYFQSGVLEQHPKSIVATNVFLRLNVMHKYNLRTNDVKYFSIAYQKKKEIRVNAFCKWRPT